MPAQKQDHPFKALHRNQIGVQRIPFPAFLHGPQPLGPAAVTGNASLPVVPRARVLIAAIVGLAVALGIWSVMAIRRTAGRRATLVDALTIRLPQVPGARTLTPWMPVADADLAHLALCFDDTDPSEAVARFVAALTGTPWRLSPVRPPATPTRASVTASDGAYRIRALGEPGRRGSCDGARRQVLLSIEAAPES